MRGFIKPRFTRLHMPFRAKAERSRHSFHLQAVGLALALLAGVLCGSFWQHAPNKMYTCLILQNNILPGTIPAAFPRQCRYPFCRL